MDYQHHAASTRDTPCAEDVPDHPDPHGPEYPFAAPSVETRCTALRLRPVGAAPAAILPARSALLWDLPAAGSAFTRRLELTYLLRRAHPLEVALNVITSWTPGFDGAPSRVPLRELQALAGVALPGFAPVAPELPVLVGETLRLPPPCVDVLDSARTTDGTRPAPHCALQSAARTLLIARHDTIMPGLDPCLVALTETGHDLDLVLELSAGPIPAATLRALREAAARLQAVLHTGAAQAPEQHAWCFARVRRWLAGVGLLRNVEIRLRFHRDADPGVARIAATMLYSTSRGSAAISPAHIDLSTALPPETPAPAIVPDYRTLEAVRRVAATRYRRPPRGPGLLLGSDAAGRKQMIAADDLRQHCYVIGATGTGKSSLLRSMIRQDMVAGVPVVVCDPHGDLHSEVLADMSPEQRHRAIIADVADFEHPFTLNILDVRGPHPSIQRNFIANQLIALFKTVYGANKEAFGPMFESYFRAALLLLMEGNGSAASLADMERVFGDTAFRRTLLEQCQDPQIRSFWHNIALKAGGDASLNTIAPYITSKLAQLSGNALIRPILCTARTSLDLSAALSEGRSVFVNLAKGLVGGPDASILGGIITVRLIAAAMARTRESRERRLVRVYLDEFPSYGAHGLLADAMAEIRKFGLSLVLANQSVAQIDGRGPDLAHAILANCGTLLGFRLGPQDASDIAHWLGPEVAPDQLLRLPNYQFVARTLRDGVPQAPVRLTCAQG